MKRTRENSADVYKRHCSNIAKYSDGRYDLSPHSYFIIKRKALPNESILTLFNFMKNDVKSSRNTYNANTFIKRKQCTIATPNTIAYFFGQDNETFYKPIDEWFKVLQDALKIVNDYTQTLNVPKKCKYNAVHMNYYPDGSSGLKAHKDDEDSIFPRQPIFSFTFLSNPNLQRFFSIYDLNDTKILDVSLGDGDLLIMCGHMQEEFKHGIEKAKPPKLYENLERVNVTFRPMKMNGKTI
jgi:hypothetical protein